MDKFELSQKPTMHCDEEGLHININITDGVLDWLSEHADPIWIASRLLENEETRQTIIDVLLGKNCFVISTSKSFDDRFREELLAKAEKKNYANLAHRLQHAIEIAEKYVRVYWDWYQNGKPMTNWAGEGKLPITEGPEFFLHNEKSKHGWPDVRKEIEDRVLGVITENEK